MSVYAHLYNTPGNGQDRVKNFEFTPLGTGKNDYDFSVLDSDKENHVAHETNNKTSSRANITSQNRDETMDSFSTSTPLINNHNPEKHNGSFNRSNILDEMDLNNINGKANYQNAQSLNHNLEEINSLKNENYGLKIKIASLIKYLHSNSPEDVQKIIMENADLKLEIHKLTSEILKINDTNIITKDSKSKTTIEFERQIQSLLNEKDNLIKSLEYLENENQALKENLEHQEVSASSLDKSANIQSLQNLIEEKDLEIDNLRNKIERLEANKMEDLKENDALEETLIDKNEEIQKLKNLIETQKNDVEKLSGDLFDLRANNSDLNSKLKSLDNQLSKKDVELSNLKMQLKNYRGNDSTKIKRIDQLMDELNSKKDQLKQYKERVRESEAELLMKNDKIEDLTAHIDSLKRQMDVSNNSYGVSDYRLQSEMDRMRKMEETLRAELSHYKLQVSHLEDLLEEQKFNELNNTSFLNNVLQVENERDKAYDDMKVYEDHILDLENKLSNYSYTVEKLQNEQKQLETQIIKVQSENESLKREMQFAKTFDDGRNVQPKPQKAGGGLFSFWGTSGNDSKSNSQNSNDSDLQTRNNVTIKKLLREKEDLQDEIKSLNLKVSHLKSELESQKQLKNDMSFERNEIKRLAKAKNDLEVLIENKDSVYDSKLKEHKEQIAKLCDELSIKDKEIENLKQKSQTVSEDLQLYKENIEKEKKIIKLESMKESNEETIKELNEKLKKLDIGNAPSAAIKKESSDKETIPEDQLRQQIEVLEESKKDLYNTMKEKLKTIEEENKKELISVKKDLLAKTRELKAYKRGTAQKRDALLETKVLYYREKFHNLLYLNQDLQFLNKFLMHSVTRSHQEDVSNLKKLMKVGITPNYNLLKQKKLTFKSLAKFVLAAVKLKNRGRKYTKKNDMLKNVQKVINDNKKRDTLTNF